MGYHSQIENMALKRMGGCWPTCQPWHALNGEHRRQLTRIKSVLIELAQAHVDKNEVRSVYSRAVFIERRQPMMEW